MQKEQQYIKGITQQAGRSREGDHITVPAVIEAVATLFPFLKRDSSFKVEARLEFLPQAYNKYVEEKISVVTRRLGKLAA